MSNSCSEGFPELKPALDWMAEKFSGWALWTTEARTCNNVLAEWNKLLASAWQPEVPLSDYWTAREKNESYSKMAAALEWVTRDWQMDRATQDKAIRLAAVLRKKASGK